MNNTNINDSHARLDLNLFRVFGVIYRVRNLTRAAEQLCISQSAVSHALARMRQQLDDPLFIREAQGVIPTALAVRIWPDVQEGLALLRRAQTHGQVFDPARDMAQVTLAMNDEVEPVLLPLLVETLRTQVPHIKVASVRVERSTLRADLAAGRLDCAIDVAQAAGSELSHTLLTRDDFVVVSRSDSPVSEADYLTAQHVTVSSRRTGRVVEDLELARSGITRQVAVRCQHYASASRLVANSDLLLTIPRNLAMSINSLLGNYIHPLPVTLPVGELRLFWHNERDQDPANVWLREVVLAAVQTEHPRR